MGKGDRPRRRPRVAGRPRSTSDSALAEHVTAQTVHDDVTIPISAKEIEPDAD
ncbi:hypothetical protein P3102_25975 [Amycolatopsis sp. QT-25]|uniref:hypothetical protein n=1 Tax=Amycolatopsis sp. QT-25 TaxID=3034022 RepID=UPI0023EB31F0|nr:hypothetical protein [Amycolatopsis sp. QT-25]WET77516.1 hypothetical protein P3102_25975 [Amycolatopsis sp. QT-25]